MINVVATTVMVGRIIGIITCQKSCHSLAPSTRAASSTSPGSPFSAADRMVMLKPVHSQIPTIIRAKLLIGWLLMKATGWAPTPVIAALSTPICASLAPVWMAYIKRQITPAPINEIAIGMKISDLTRLS